jgi:hypothetical protein
MKKQKTKAWVPSPPPSRLKRNPPKKKEKPPPPKLAYHMTQEELEESVRKLVTDHFVPKKHEPKQPMSPAVKKYFKSLVQPKIINSLARRTAQSNGTPARGAFKIG